MPTFINSDVFLTLFNQTTNNKAIKTQTFHIKIETKNLIIRDNYITHESIPHMFVTKVNYAFRPLALRIALQLFIITVLLLYFIALHNSENNNFCVDLYACLHSARIHVFIWLCNCDSCF